MSFETSFRIRFGDTDPYGVVYFATYFRYAHQALENFLRAHQLEPTDLFRNSQRNLGLPVIAASGEFKKPLKYGEEVKARVSPVTQGDSSITFRIEFRQEEIYIGNVVLVLVAIDSSWNPRKLPPELAGLEVKG